MVNSSLSFARNFILAERTRLRSSPLLQAAKRYMLASRKFCGRRNSRWKKPKKVAFETNLSESEQGIR